MDNQKSIDNNNNESPKKQNSGSSITPKFTMKSSTTRKTSGGSEHPSKRWGHSVILYNKSMIIFGGRHLQRSLSNIYSLDFTTLTWSKIDPGNPPPARDSHSAVIFNNSDMIIFGGNGSTSKLNDLWDFNLEDKKWIKINMEDTEGPTPSPRDGHLSSLIYEKYMVIYAGLNDKDEVANDIFLFDIENKKWLECEIEGNISQNKDGQSCCLVGDILYLFGGQGPLDDEFSNDLFTMEFVILNDNSKTKPKAIISPVEINGNIKPRERASQSCVVYKDQYLIIIGGEGTNKEPLNDIWLFDLKNKCYNEVQLTGNDKIEGRFCHSCIIYEDTLALYGGMKNSDATLDNLTILSIELNQNKKSNNNKNNNNKYIEIINNKKKKIEDNLILDNQNDEEDITNQDDKNNMEDFATDTNDLLNMNFYSFEEIKKNYLNNLLTWQFLKSLSDFYKWPIGCIGNFIKNSLKEYVNSKNVYIDIKKIKEDEIYLSIKDDGKGISCKDFNGIMFSFIKNQNKELNYFQYGFTMKATALRLADSFLIISKTTKEVSIGMISKELQNKIKDSDYILTPIVNYRIEKKIETNKMKYIPKSNFPFESINLILEIIPFLFKNMDELMEYFDSFDTGTHIFLFDLQTTDKSEIGYLKNSNENKLNIGNYNESICSNYELIFDKDENDIYLNEEYEFNEDMKKNIIDFSFKKYITFMFLKPYKGVNIFLFDQKIDFENPYYNIKLMSSPGNNMKKITNLNYNNENEQNEKIDCFNIEGSDYKGILFNENFIDSITSNTNLGIDDIKEKDYLNGILLYKDNMLISRLNQPFLGDFNFFIKKMMNINNNMYKNNENGFCNIIIGNDNNHYLCKNIFKKNGYIELPSTGYELMFNNMEIKDQALFGYIYNKIKALTQCISKKNI